MASFRQRNNTWRAEISVNGIRESSTFDTKAQARAWASKRETQLREQSHGKLPDHSFLEAIERYLSEVSVKKKTHENEVKRMAFFKREYKKLCQKQLAIFKRMRLMQLLLSLVNIQIQSKRVPTTKRPKNT